MLPDNRHFVLRVVYKSVITIIIIIIIENIFKGINTSVIQLPIEMGPVINDK